MKEIIRKNDNNLKILIPDIIIEGREEVLTFNEIELKPHNLRNDIFKEEVITAIDLILTLGDICLIDKAIILTG